MQALPPFQGFALGDAFTQRLRAGLLSCAASRRWATAPQALGSQSAAMRALKGREMEALSPLQGYLRWGTHDPALTRWAIL